MRFVMFMIPAVYGTRAADEVPSEEMIDAMMGFNADLADAGVLELVEGLHPPSTGLRVEFRADGTHAGDVPAAGAVGGFWIIKVDSTEAAHEWAARCPALPGDILEVRRMEDFEDAPGDPGDSAAGWSR